MYMDGGLKKMSFAAIMVAVIVAASINMQCATAQQHHIVGGDHGWGSSSDLVSWASDKIFRVGDNIWFAYSAAKDSIVELSSVEDFESCNLENPIKMYSDGIDRVALEKEGIRYFASSKPENCQKGLKLNLTVLPRENTDKPTVAKVAATEAAADDVADKSFSATAPAPSASVRTTRLSSVLVVFIGLGLISSLAF